MGKRSYDQFCAIARSLDIIGGRWTLLIIRELLTGPKRYKHLMENLPGIGTNLLANRLKLLEKHSIIKQVTLPPPAEVDVYDLTEWGNELEDVILSIVQWGSPLLESGPQDDYVRAGWAILGLKGLFDQDKVVQTGISCQFNISDDQFWVRIDEDELVTHEGVLTEHDIEFTTDLHHFSLLASGDLELMAGIQQGKIEIDGDQQTVIDFFTPFQI